MVEGGIDVAQEHLPVVLIDPEPAMGQLHVASDVVQRATGGSTEEIDQELFFAPHAVFAAMLPEPPKSWIRQDRKSTRLNSSHTVISYAVFCLKKKKQNTKHTT